MKTFTAENFDNLKKVCEKIISISDENIDGDLMAIQLICLGDNIKDFIENPIVKNSGIIKDEECLSEIKNIDCSMSIDYEKCNPLNELYEDSNGQW